VARYRASGSSCEHGNKSSCYRKSEDFVASWRESLRSRAVLSSYLLHSLTAVNLHSLYIYLVSVSPFWNWSSVCSVQFPRFALLRRWTGSHWWACWQAGSTSVGRTQWYRRLATRLPPELGVIRPQEPTDVQLHYPTVVEEYGPHGPINGSSLLRTVYHMNISCTEQRTLREADSRSAC
jgi:hypothetical protein